MNIRAQVYGYSPSEESPLVLAKQPKGVRAGELHSIPIERRELRLADTRAEERTPAGARAAKITHKGNTYNVQLMNRCSSGAMVAAELDGLPWDKVQLYLKELGIIECSLMWMKNGFVGLRFAEEVMPAGICEIPELGVK